MVVASAAICGVVMFAYYNKCDPLQAGKIATPDMVLETRQRVKAVLSLL